MHYNESRFYASCYVNQNYTELYLLVVSTDLVKYASQLRMRRESDLGNLANPYQTFGIEFSVQIRLSIFTVRFLYPMFAVHVVWQVSGS